MASNDITRLIEELNETFATDNQEEPSETEADEADQVEKLNDHELTELNEEEILAESKKVSMFCRNCLSPYFGQKGKGGSIILKCKKCNHRDIITEDDLQDTSPDHSASLELGGNIILNRFTNVLLEKNELHNIDVDNPNFMNDEFKELSEALPRVTGIMKQTFSAMHKVTDDHRKLHNIEMLRLLAQEGRLEKVDGEDGSKVLKFSVPVHGSEADDDIIILPERYSLPDSSMNEIQTIGRDGLQKADFYILSFGIPNKQIRIMPLFQRRLVSYCRYAQHLKGSGTDKSLEVIKSSRVDNIQDRLSNVNLNDENPKENYFETISQSKKTYDQSSTITASEYLEGNAEIPETNELPVDTKRLKHCQLGETKHTNNLDLQPKAAASSTSSVHNSDNFQNSYDSDLQPEINALSESGTLQTNVDNYDECNLIDEENRCIQKTKNAEPCEDSDSDDDFSFALKHGKLIPELDEFYDIVHSEEKLQDLVKCLPTDTIISEETKFFTYEETHEAFSELTSTMILRANIAKQQRMQETMRMIKNAARSVAEEVDKVQDDMIKELQIAYKSKRIKAEKQRKRLEETQEELDHYRGLITHYTQTGQMDKVFEIIQILRDYNKPN